jgi:hypothetical protein
MFHESKNLTREAIAAWLKGEKIWHLLSGYEYKWSCDAASSSQHSPWRKSQDRARFSKLMAEFLGYAND